MAQNDPLWANPNHQPWPRPQPGTNQGRVPQAQAQAYPSYYPPNQFNTGMGLPHPGVAPSFPGVFNPANFPSPAQAIPHIVGPDRSREEKKKAEPDPKEFGDPNDWKETTDKQTGKTYYYNSVTKKSSWTRPPGFLTEKEKLQPISSEKIPDTSWTIVNTRGGKAYYNNSETGETVWTLPEGVKIPPKPTPASKERSTPVQTEENPLKRKLAGTKMAQIGAALDAKRLKTDELNKKKTEDSKHDSDEDSDEEFASLKKLREKAAAEASTTPDIPYDDKIRIFKELLTDNEKKIRPFSSYKANVPVLVYDTRFKILGSESEKKATFESWMRVRVTESKKNVHTERKAIKKKLETEFREMLDELGSKITYHTSYEDLRHLCKDDPRFLAIENKHERNLLLTEKTFPLREAHLAQKKVAENEFKELLETLDIDPHARWDKVKRRDGVADDPRYNLDLLSSKDREKLFEAFVKTVAKEQELKKSKKTREELIRKEREREVQQQREQEERKLAREREKLRYDEEVARYTSLLAEHVSSAKASWHDTRPKLSQDPRFNTQLLNGQDKERLFYDRITLLQGSQDRELLELLKNRSHQWNLGSSWEDIKTLFAGDPRFNSDRATQVQFETHLQQERAEAERLFTELLWGFNKIKRGIEIDSKEYLTIRAILKNDPVWQRLDPLSDRRDTLFHQHIKFVNDGGERPQVKMSKSVHVPLKPDKAEPEKKTTSSRSDIRSDRGYESRGHRYDQHSRNDDRGHRHEYSR